MNLFYTIVVFSNALQRIAIATVPTIGGIVADGMLAFCALFITF